MSGGKRINALLFTLGISGSLLFAFPSFAAEVIYPNEPLVALSDNPVYQAYQYIDAHPERFRGLALKLIRIQHSLTAHHLVFAQVYNDYYVLERELIISLGNSLNVVTRVYDNTQTIRFSHYQWQHPWSAAHTLKRAYTRACFLGMPLKQSGLTQIWQQDEHGELHPAYLIALSTPTHHWQGVAAFKSDGQVKITPRTTQYHTRLDDLTIAQKTKDVLDVCSRQYIHNVLHVFQQRDASMLSLDSLYDILLPAWLKPQQRLETVLGEKRYVGGMARVFDPTPNVSLASDTVDLDSPPSLLFPAYRQRRLPAITYNKQDNLYDLSGPWVKITDFAPPHTLVTRSVDGRWFFQSGQPGFRDATAYFHIDQNQRYIQQLGYVSNKGIQNQPIEVDTDGLMGEAGAYYDPYENRIAFGSGYIFAAEDAEIILHEYGHALSFFINPLLSAGDAGGLSEGFSDYWAASYRYHQPNGERFHPDWVFVWSGHNRYWPGRSVAATQLYYEDGRDYGDHMPLGVGHFSEELWSTPLFQAMRKLNYQGIPQSAVDRVILEAQFGFGSHVTMRQMAQSIVNTAAQMYPDTTMAAVFKQQFTQQHLLLE